MKSFLEILFDPAERVCASVDDRGTALMPRDNASSDHQFISVNPFRPGSSRADRNVAVYRSFLVEFDGMPIEKQIPHAVEIGLPWSTVVFSGKKSYHFVVSLAQPLDNEKAYRTVFDQIRRAVPGVDRANCNPSRFTRFPGHLREETEKLQYCPMTHRGRVPTAAFLAWLESRGAKPRELKKRIADEVRLRRSLFPSSGPRAPHSSRTGRFLRYGASAPGASHREAMQAAFDLAGCGYLPEEVESMLEKAPWPSVDENEVSNIVRHVFKESA